MAYNPDKTLTNNLRFSIMPLHWIKKYLDEKPCLIVFLLNSETEPFLDILRDLIEIFDKYD